MMAASPATPTRLRLADLLAALSVVTDLGIGRLPEAAMQACLLSTRLAEHMRLDAGTISDVYYTTLLRYIGCTAFAHEEAAFAGGDELKARAETTRIDYANPRELLSYYVWGIGKGEPPLRRMGLVATALPWTLLSSKALIAAHCEVGTAMARRLEMTPTVQRSLEQIFERWDGKGWPNKLRGDNLCLPVRFAHVATHAVAYNQIEGSEVACEVVDRRSGGMYDPAIANAFQQYGLALLEDLATVDVWKAVVDAEPEPRRVIPEGNLDEVARAFADMTDLKAPFFRGHSPGVAELAEAAVLSLGLPDADAVLIRRAALFHDLGRVGVPNGIWEKRGPLTEREWEQVRLHPYHTERILSRSPALAPLARPAGMHHERQDGSGYHRQAMGASIPITARVLAAADVYGAATQSRPYRPALEPAAAAKEMEAEARAGRLDLEAVRAVLGAAGHRQSRKRQAWPAGLSDREIEVLRLIARGASYRDVANDLVISPRTAAHHVQHIYDKIGVSSRAAAAMFAMEHDLVR